MQTFSKPHAASKKGLLLFILGWLSLNLVQAALMGIDGDEAYYWLYTQELQWGYFDHPPLVALSIKCGELFGHGPLYTRLVTVLLSAGTLYFGFRLLPQSLQHVRLYLLSFASVVLFHVYSFIATPDAALLFFTTLFFYGYKKYLEKETLAHIVLLAFSITGLLYSKYHGVLPLFFVALSYPKLILKPSAWAVVLLVVLLFSPHLWWQYTHDWPTFWYHLSERIGSAYRFSKTSDYITGQLFIWGPLTTIPALYFILKNKKKYGLYERAHRFTFWGVLLFFLASSFRSTIEPHWTLVAGPSFVVLLHCVLINASEKRKKIFKVLLGINVLLIVLLRTLFLIPGSPVKRIKAFEVFFYAKPWADTMRNVAAGRPVVFVDSYKLPALYQYYNPGIATWDYNTVRYRKTQFNLYTDSFLNHKNVVLASKYPLTKDNFTETSSAQVFKTPYIDLYLHPLDSFKAVNSLQLRWTAPATALRKGEKPNVVVLLHNAGTSTVAAEGLYINYSFIKTRNEQHIPPSRFLLPETLPPPGAKKQLNITLDPPAQRGTYKLVFSIVQPPLDGTIASPYYKVAIE
jgi:hypothetical protein